MALHLPHMCSLLAAAEMNKRKVGASHAAPAAGLGSAMQCLAHGHIRIQSQKVAIPGVSFSH